MGGQLKASPSVKNKSKITPKKEGQGKCPGPPISVNPMANWQKIQIVCEKCKGTKKIFIVNEETREVEISPNPCLACDGKGYVPWGRLRVDADPE